MLKANKLKQLKSSIDTAVEKARRARNEEDRKFIVANVGKDLVSVLTPLLKEIAQNSRMNATEIQNIISAIKVEAPSVSVDQPKIEVIVPEIKVPEANVNIPEIKLPKIVVPVPRVIVKPAEVKIPKEMEVKGLKGLIKSIADALKQKPKIEFNQKKPLNVILTDEKGKKYKALTKMALGGGGGNIIQKTPNIDDTNNSTTALLGIGGVYTGTGVDVIDYQTITIMLSASHDSAVDGMTFQFSTDNINWDDVYTFTMDISASDTRRFQFPVTGRYFRVVYTNGGTLQTHFRVQTLLHPRNSLTSIHRLVTDMSPDRSAQVVKSTLFAQINGAGDFTPIQANSAGVLKVGGSIEAEPHKKDVSSSHVTKYYTNVGAVTDGIIWSPAAGKRWYITDIFINTSTAATIILEDDKTGGDDPVWKAELAGNSGWSHSFQTPLFSGEDTADLTITTSGGTVYVMVTGYEV